MVSLTLAALAASNSPPTSRQRSLYEVAPSTASHLAHSALLPGWEITSKFSGSSREG